ncbi:MAG: M3 family metallopeptidase [Bacteroidales bacterium]|nr:M3 family metallopeptidase [Bacteroidales bacterium]
MKKLNLIAAAMIITSCTRTNPFLTEWDTPYGTPPFDEITTEDYIPALEEGIRQHDEEIRAITSCAEKPTFENTIVPLELSGALISKVGGVLGNIAETDRTDELDSIMEVFVKLTTEHENKISFNKSLFKRIEKVYKADQSKLTREQQVVLKNYYDEFVLNGINLPAAMQKQLGEINAEIAAKAQKIGNNILAESNAFKEEFGISVSEYPDAMTSTEDRALREKMLKAYTSRGHNGNANDNRELIADVLRLRQMKAQMLGFKNYAAYKLSDNMAHDPETVDAFLDGIMKAAVAKAKEEVADMQKIMDEDIAAGKVEAGSKIEPWDWWYYSEKVRKVKYDLNEELTKPYFKLENVVKGVFAAAKTLYGVNMEKIEGVPAYNEKEVTTYKVTADDGSLIGIFTTDYFPRASKRGGAWMNNVRSQYVDAQGNDVRPIIVNVGNLAENLSIDQVQTVFHEFGHALHGLLTKCTYKSVSGTSVKHDFVEMFSQFNENWAFQPELLKQYALNDKGEVIPAELVEKINNSLQFNQGFMTTELCAASILDMKWHELEDLENVDIDEFEAKTCKEMGLIPEIGPRYRSTYFNHIFASGYEAGYYAYLWAEVLDKDAFSIFTESGEVFNLDLAKKFKETFLEKGGSEEPMVLYKSFAGREPDNTAFLKARGLK